MKKTISQSTFTLAQNFHHYQTRLEEKGVKSSDVRRPIMEPDPLKAYGPDGITLFVLQECAETLAKPLRMLSQISLEEGNVPTQTTRRPYVG